MTIFNDRIFLNNLIDIPIASVMALTPERAVLVMRAILRSECGYAKLSPAVLTISSRLTIADGGIDAEINVPPEHTIRVDCMFQPGLTGFQIKSATAFKPWTRSAIRTELLTGEGKLCFEVGRLVQRGGRYALICTGLQGETKHIRVLGEPGAALNIRNTASTISKVPRLSRG